MRLSQKVKGVLWWCEIFNILFSYEDEDIGRFSNRIIVLLINKSLNLFIHKVSSKDSLVSVATMAPKNNVELWKRKLKKMGVNLKF